MNKNELEYKLNLLEVRPSSYALEGELLPDRIVLYNSYHNWEVFYLDERGGRNDVKVFSSEDEACQYIYEIFRDIKEVEKKYGLRTSDSDEVCVRNA